MDEATKRTEFIVMIHSLLHVRPNVVRVQPSGDFDYMVMFGTQLHFIDRKFHKQLDQTLTGTGYKRHSRLWSKKVTYVNENPLKYDVRDPNG